MTIRSFRGLLLILLAVLIGCDGSPDHTSQWPGEGTQILQNSPPYPSWAIDSASALRIGTAIEGDAEGQFWNVRYAATLSDGRIVVVDGGRSEIRWFNEDGTFDSRAGGRGEGPGELGHVKSGTLLPGDTLVLVDSRNQRLSWFDSMGKLVRTRRLGLGPSLGVTLQAFESGRLLVAVESPNHNFGGFEYNYARDSVFAVLISDASEPDTLLRLPGKEAVTWVDYIDGQPRGTQQMELPFGRGTLVGGVDGSVAVVRSGEGDLVFFSPDGRAVRSAHRSDLDPPPVSAEFRQRYLESAAEQAMAAGTPVGLARAGAEGRLDLLPEGRRVPVYDRMLIDQVGERIWLRDFIPPWTGDDPQSWTVHDKRGRIVARLTTPAGFNLMHVAQNRLAGVSRDGMGVEYVNVYQLERPPA